MVICILVSNDHIDVARENAKKIEKFANHTSLSIPVSESGDAPATHWFCTFNASEEVYQSVKEIQEFSEVIESDPKQFLESRNLKIISWKKMVSARKEEDKQRRKSERDTK